MAVPGAPSPPRRMAREGRRASIVQAAARVFDGRDPATVPFEQVADEAGISRPLLYRYFRDRADLVAAVQEHHAAVLRARVAAALESSSGLRAAVRAAVAVHVAAARDDAYGYLYATGTTPGPGGSAVEDELVDELAASFGGTPAGRIVGIGLLHALRAMASASASAATDEALGVEQAVDLVTLFLFDGLASLDDVGVELTPRWRVPVAANGEPQHTC